LVQVMSHEHFQKQVINRWHWLAEPQEWWAPPAAKAKKEAC